MSANDPTLLSAKLRQRLDTLAGSDAIDCGFATERTSAEQVYTRATAALAARRAFYCMYQTSPGLFPVRIDGYPPVPPAPPWPVGYVGRADGVVFRVRQNSDGLLVRGTNVLPGATSSPRRLDHGMTTPVVVSFPTAPLDGPAASIEGIVIVEASIEIDGTIADTRVIKPLPLGISEIAERLVQQSTFQPSRFFGVLVPVLYNIVVESRMGQVSVR